MVAVTGTDDPVPDLQTVTVPEGLVAIVTVGAVLLVAGLFGDELVGVEFVGVEGADDVLVD
jgi:hypothetical protein